MSTREHEDVLDVAAVIWKMTDDEVPAATATPDVTTAAKPS